MIEVKTSELIGPALDWAVAKAAKLTMFEMGDDGNWPGNYHVTQATQVEPAVIRDLTGNLHLEASLRTVPWSPSTDWAQGGPLIERHGISLHCPQSTDDVWAAWIVTPSGEFCCGGETPLIAACRAIVAAHSGDTVQIPDELAERAGQ